VRLLGLAILCVANVAVAEDAPLVVARLPTRETREHVVDAVCSLRISGVDVSIDGHRCAFGFAEAESVPLTVTARDGVLVFESRVDPELVRSARAAVDLRLTLGDDHAAGTWVVSTWHPRSLALRDAGLVGVVLGSSTIFAASLFAFAAYLTAHPLFCFHLFEPEASCAGDPTALTIAAGVTFAAGVMLTSLGGAAYKAGRMKVAVVPTGVRVSF